MKGLFLESIQEKAKADPKTIVYPEGAEERIILAAQKVIKQGFAKIILIGDAGQIAQKAKALKVSLKSIRIIDIAKYERFEEMANTFFELRKHKGITIEQAKEQVKKANYFGTMLVQMGEADGLVSGLNSETKPFLPAFQIIGTKEPSHKASGFFMMIWPKDNKILFFADSSTIIDPDENDLANIAIDTAESAKRFGIEPKVALLSFSTRGSAKHMLVDKVANATKIAREKRPDLLIDGEMQVDAAIVPEVADKKCPDSPLHGNANVLIFPDLNSGNIAYKLVERLAKASAVGPVLQGLKKPVNDLSRGCSVQDIVDVTAITVVEAQQAL